jgi:hypothetical protein
MLWRMATPVPNPTATSGLSPRLKHWVVKISVLVLLGLLFGFGHGWAASRYYGPERVAGFHMGLLHGALMPAALPALLSGKDLPIYAPRNEGRPYNIGYILGINSCGTLFFGIGFWPMRKRG